MRNYKYNAMHYDNRNGFIAVRPSAVAHVVPDGKGYEMSIWERSKAPKLIERKQFPRIRDCREYIISNY